MFMLIVLTPQLASQLDMIMQKLINGTQAGLKLEVEEVTAGMLQLTKFPMLKLSVLGMVICQVGIKLGKEF